MTRGAADARELIGRLVAFPTVSAQSNLDLIEFVRDYLRGHGIDGRLTFDADKRKANLFATIGPELPGGIVLSGHTDVVPVEGQPWATDPFAAVARDGRIYGRGTADMKSFIALALTLVPEMKRAKLRVPFHLALTYDEEVGCLGVPGLLRDIADNVPRPALAIIGEPTSMQIGNSHKGLFAFRTIFSGRAGHSSAPHKGLNAIDCANEFLGVLAALAAEWREQGPHDERFDPPYTSCNVGRIEGGSAFNIVADRCEVTWEFRPLPNADPDAIKARLQGFLNDDLLPRMRAQLAAASIETVPICGVEPFLEDPDSPAEALVRMISRVNQTVTMAFGTEAGHYQRSGIPAVVFGPGSIDQAHQPDEYIEVAQIEAYAGFLRDLIAWASEQT